MLTGSYVKMVFSFPIVCNISVTACKFIYYVKLHLFRNNIFQTEKRRKTIVDLKSFHITFLVMNFSSKFLNFCFKMGDRVPRYGSIMKSYFLGTVRITFYGKELCEKRPYLELFWSLFFLIRTECGEIRSIFLYTF